MVSGELQVPVSEDIGHRGKGDSRGIGEDKRREVRKEGTRERERI